MILYARI